MEETLTVSCLGQETLFGTKLLFACEELRELVIGAEICEDLWTPEPPGIRHARNGATVLGTFPHRMRRRERKIIAEPWYADSRQGFYADIFMRVPERASLRRMSFTPVTI